jgi:ketosteroid isomerase-like protein
MHQRCFSAAVVGLFLALCRSAQANQSEVGPALLKVAEEWARPIAAADVQTIARYALDDACSSVPVGRPLTKEARLPQFMDGPRRGATPPTRTPTADEHRNQVFGSTVIHTYRLSGISPQGQTGQTRQLQVWVKQQGQWKVSASEATYIAQP